MPALAYPSLAAAIVAGAERFGEGSFVSFGLGGARQDIPWCELLAQAWRLVDGLRAEGFEPGDGLVIRLSAAERIAAAIQAAALGGYVAVPMTTGAQTGRLPDPLRSAFVRICILDTAAFDRLLAVPAPGRNEIAPCKPGDLRVAIPTSGTTGHARLVGLSDGAALARWWPQIPDASHASGFLSWTSFDHVMGIGLAMPDLPLKAHLDTAQFIKEPLSWLDVLEATGATHATMTSFGLGLVVRELTRTTGRSWRLDHVRKIGVGAEMVSRRISGDFLKALAPFGLRDDALIAGYGLSECGPVSGGGTPFIAGDGPEDEPLELDRPTRGHAIRIVGETGYLLREGEIGHIEVSGPTMTSGYIGDDAANATLFTADGWLRTGDLGLLREGRLTVTGREKELILVNAKKYTCQEVEAILRERASLAEAYAAPLPIGAAGGVGAPCAVFIVTSQPREETLETTARQVREAVASALHFSPAIVALIRPDQVSHTALGKVRRLALPELLTQPETLVQDMRRRTPAPASRDSSDTTRKIAALWRELLDYDGDLDPDVDFFALGGDSLLALQLSFRLEAEFDIPVDIQQFPTVLSISELARFLSGAPAQTPFPLFSDRHSEAELPDWCSERLHGFLQKWPGVPALPNGFIRQLDTVQIDGRRSPPVFWCMQVPEEASIFAAEAGSRISLYAMRSGVQLFDYDTPVARAVAARYADEIDRIQPKGPIILGGNCQGATLGIDILRKLKERGREIRLFAVADAPFAVICRGEALSVPVALFPAHGSKFNPGRWFRHPGIGLSKLAPRGFYLRTIHAQYGRIMFRPACKYLMREFDAALAWVGSLEQESAPTTAPPPAAFYQRKLTSPHSRLELRAGEAFTLSVRLKNTSPVAWEAFSRSGLMLGNHWLSEHGEILVWSDGRTPLERPLEPGARIFTTLEIVVPDNPGPAILEVDLVEEGIRWFAEVASPPLQIPVIIRPRSALVPSRGAGPKRLQIFPALFRLADRFRPLTRPRRRK